MRHTPDWLNRRIDSFTGAATPQVESILAMCNRDIDDTASTKRRVALPEQHGAQASSVSRSSLDVLAGLLSGSAPAQGPRCAARPPARAHPLPRCHSAVSARAEPSPGAAWGYPVDAPVRCLQVCKRMTGCCAHHMQLLQGAAGKAGALQADPGAKGAPDGGRGW